MLHSGYSFLWSLRILNVYIIRESINNMQLLNRLKWVFHCVGFWNT